MDSSLGSSAMKASGPSMSLDKGAGGGGVGNYKGVMLCNRPFAGSVAQANKAAGNNGGAKGTFVCGLVADAAGVNVSMSSKDQKKVKRPKKETVLTKHRRWLADLQKTKDKLEMQYIDEMKAKDAARNAFQQQEKQMRLLAKEIQSDDAQPETNSPAQAEAKEVSSVAKAMSKRPAWAQTEEVARAANEDKDELDLDDDEGLLDFASNLNFENVIGDIEVRSMMQKLKERIASLEHDITQDDLRAGESSQRAQMRELRGVNGEGSTGEEDDHFDENEDLKELAKLVLDNDGTLGGVHSQASVESMLKQAKEKIATCAAVSEAKINGADKQEMGAVQGGPNIVLHEPNEGKRVGDKGVANLPYMHRNPAV